MSTAKERFQTVLADQFRQLFELPEYSRVASSFTPEALAEKMTAGLLEGTADKDGEGVKRSCKTLGIKPTYKAIKAFLTNG